MTDREKLETMNLQLLAAEENMRNSIETMKEAIAKSEHVRFWITNTLNQDKKNILGGD